MHLDRNRCLLLLLSETSTILSNVIKKTFVEHYLSRLNFPDIQNVNLKKENAYNKRTCLALNNK